MVDQAIKPILVSKIQLVGQIDVVDFLVVFDKIQVGNQVGIVQQISPFRNRIVCLIVLELRYKQFRQIVISIFQQFKLMVIIAVKGGAMNEPTEKVSSTVQLK